MFPRQKRLACTHSYTPPTCLFFTSFLLFLCLSYISVWKVASGFCLSVFIFEASPPLSPHTVFAFVSADPWIPKDVIPLFHDVIFTLRASPYTGPYSVCVQVKSRQKVLSYSLTPSKVQHVHWTAEGPRPLIWLFHQQPHPASLRDS